MLRLSVALPCIIDMQGSSPTDMLSREALPRLVSPTHKASRGKAKTTTTSAHLIGREGRVVQAPIAQIVRRTALVPADPHTLMPDMR